jgi:hypothetical protein
MSSNFNYLLKYIIIGDSGKFFYIHSCGKVKYAPSICSSKIQGRTPNYYRSGIRCEEYYIKRKNIQNTNMGHGKLKKIILINHLF